MKLQLKQMVFIGISLMFFSSIGFAELMYVPDGEALPLRTGPSRGHKIITLVDAGQKMEILESGKKWSQVRLANGKEGYVLTEYLITEERWRQTREAKRKKQELAAQTGKHKQNAHPNPLNTLSQQNKKNLKKSLNQLQAFTWQRTSKDLSLYVRIDAEGMCCASGI